MPKPLKSRQQISGGHLTQRLSRAPTQPSKRFGNTLLYGFDVPIGKSRRQPCHHLLVSRILELPRKGQRVRSQVPTVVDLGKPVQDLLQQTALFLYFQEGDSDCGGRSSQSGTQEFIRSYLRSPSVPTASQYSATQVWRDPALTRASYSASFGKGIIDFSARPGS